MIKKYTRMDLEDEFHNLAYEERVEISEIKNDVENYELVDCNNGYMMLLEKVCDE